MKVSVGIAIEINPDNASTRLVDEFDLDLLRCRLATDNRRLQLNVPDDPIRLQDAVVPGIVDLGFRNFQRTLVQLPGQFQ